MDERDVANGVWNGLRVYQAIRFNPKMDECRRMWCPLAIYKNHSKCNSFRGKGILYTHFHRNYEYKVLGIVALWFNF